MKKQKYIYVPITMQSLKLLILLLIVFVLMGCEKELEPENPKFLLSEDAAFEDIATVKAVMANIYSGIRDNSPVSGNTNGLSVRLGLYTDELDYYSAASQSDYAFYNHTVVPTTNVIPSFWNNSYSLIFSVNAALEGLEKSSLATEEKEIYLGEAYFLRAYLHFYLAQIFGDIPYIQSTDYKTNAAVSRMTLDEVNQNLEQDLLMAVNMLPEIDNSGQKLIPSKGTAHAMLARFYLFTGQWDKAYTESNTVITNGNFTWQPDLSQVFLKESTSTIWQLQTQWEGSPTHEAMTFVFEVGPPYLYALTDEFISDFELGDLRREAWTRLISDGTQDWHHSFKYKQYMFGDISTEYSILLRLAEQYLIRAEASLNNGDFQGAIVDLNIIRVRAGLEPFNGNSQDEIREEIVKQRRFELFCEQGHRWFDLKRLELAGEVLGPLKVGWKPTDILFPLPQQELLLNPNLNPQNPGY